MELNNESIESIRKRIDETEQEIDKLNAEINGMADEKNRLETAYNTAKEDYESFKSYYTEESTSGLYFFIVSALTFVVILFLVLTDEIVDFFIYPATALLVVSIVLRVIGTSRFKNHTPAMEEKTKVYESSKEAYEKFMETYTATETELEKKQYQWELVENDMIEARKDAWVAQQKMASAE